MERWGYESSICDNRHCIGNCDKCSRWSERGEEIKSVNEWLDRKDLQDGYTIANAKLKRDYNRLQAELRKRAGALYCVGVKMDNHYATKMMRSAKKQADFCAAVSACMSTRKVDMSHVSVFEKDVKQLEKRLEQIDRITKEVIHLTKYEPFFEIEGNNLLDMDFSEVADKADEWNEQHKDIVEEHMEKVRPEIERHEKYINKVHADAKKNREDYKNKKKAEDAYVKELKENREKNRREYERIEKTFEPHYTWRG